MKNLCKMLAYIELILGVIGSISLANVLGLRVSYTSHSIERDSVLTFTIFLSSMLCVVTLWAILCAFSEILENQEKLLARSGASVSPMSRIEPICDIAAPPVSRPFPTVGAAENRLITAPPTQRNTVINDDEWKKYDTWKCPNCKRINGQKDKVCTCGASKPNN